jgi:mono/diheme cytochrome c family protein
MRLSFLATCVTAGSVLGVFLPGLQDAAPSPAQIALGDSVFRGLSGGALCYVCHGPQGKGIAGLGPNLSDKEWLNADGTLASIEKVVTEGVPKPKKMPSPMPPKGGGQLSESQIKAVAAYVYSLSHPVSKP